MSNDVTYDAATTQNISYAMMDTTIIDIPCLPSNNKQSNVTTSLLPKLHIKKVNTSSRKSQFHSDVSYKSQRKFCDTVWL
jgi:hypothetical protein